MTTTMTTTKMTMATKTIMTMTLATMMKMKTMGWQQRATSSEVAALVAAIMVRSVAEALGDGGWWWWWGWQWRMAAGALVVALEGRRLAAQQRRGVGVAVV